MSLLKNMIRLHNKNSLSFEKVLYPNLKVLKSFSRITSVNESSYSTKRYQDFTNSPKFKAFKAKQAKMQCDDGYPVHLKGGLIDKILYHVTVGACIIGLVQCFSLYYHLIKL